MAQNVSNTVKYPPLSSFLSGGLSTKTKTTTPSGVGLLSAPSQPAKAVEAPKVAPAQSAPSVAQPVKQTVPPPVANTAPQAQETQSAPVKGLVTFPGLASGLANFDPFARPEVSEAYKRTQELNRALGESKQNEAKGTATLLRQPIPLGDQEGQARVLQDQYLKQQAALASELQGSSNIFGAGLTGTQQQLSGLGTAAGLVPEALRYEGFGGGSLSPQNRAQEVARQVRDGLISPQQGEALMSSLYGGAGATFLNQALQGTEDYNYITGGAEAAGRSATLQNLPALESANTAAEGIKNTIVAYLNANPNLNPSTLAASNILQQWIQGKQLTDPKYQTLFNYLNEYTNTLAPILGVGGQPTNLKTEIAQGFLNAAASGQSIAEVLNSMSQLATDKLQNIRSGATGGGVVTSPATGGNISVQASDGATYDFYQDANGNWVAR